MDQLPQTTAGIMQHWKDRAAEVPREKREEIVKLMRTGSTIGETRVAVHLPLMLVVQIIIEEFTRIEEAVCKSLSGTKQS